ncbi:MAG: prolyl oligopeptidase family serine peptidase [Capsulimonadaceae bacterium]
MKNLHSIVVLTALFAAGLPGLPAAAAPDAAAQTSAGPPVAAVRPVTETFYGHKVTDNYRYMENLKDPYVVAWFKGQADYTNAALARIPGRATLLKEIKKLDSAGEAVSDLNCYGGRYFYLKSPPTAVQPRLYVRDGLHGAERLLVNPEKLAAGGVHYAIDYFTPSLDGRYVACAISKGGSEDSVLHVLDAASGKDLGERITRTQYGGVSWLPDNHSFFYIRLRDIPDSTSIERYKKSAVHLHVLGRNPDRDPAVFGWGLSPHVSMTPTDDPSISYTPGSPYLYATVTHGVQREITMYDAPLRAYHGAATPWRKVCDTQDDVITADSHGSWIFLLTHKNAPRFKVVRTRASAPDMARATTILPAGQAVLTELGAAADAVYVHALDGGVGRILRVPFDGGHARELPLPYDGAVDGLFVVWNRPGLLYLETGWTHSALWYQYDPRTNRVFDTGIKKLSPIKFTGILSKEVKARGADGVLIPLSIVYPAGIKLDGSHPTLMEGYGAYGITLDPYFSPTSLPWLQRGGVLAVAHVRGGGEYGEDWHLAGMKLTKPNTWRDLIACGQYLINKGYTSPKYLAITGASAGGITVGRALTERPDLFGAVVDDVGVSNPLRSEFSPNGPPNIPEFGTVTTPDGFRALYAMDSTQHVKPGVHYPAVMLTTGINDPRVSSWEPAKMTAYLQAATASDKPILLRVDYDAGHGMGSTKAQEDALLADTDSFLLWQFGVPGFQPEAAASTGASTP